jgi:hypothetical protein
MSGKKERIEGRRTATLFCCFVEKRAAERPALSY